MLGVGVLSEDSLRERYSMLRQNVLASTLMRLVPSGKGTGTFIPSTAVSAFASVTENG